MSSYDELFVPELRISNQQSPIADLEHPFAFSPIDIAECIRMFQIGERVLLIAN
jgi:hypothetical protein